MTEIKINKKTIFGVVVALLLLLSSLAIVFAADAYEGGFNFWDWFRTAILGQELEVFGGCACDEYVTGGECNLDTTSTGICSVTCPSDASCSGGTGGCVFVLYDEDWNFQSRGYLGAGQSISCGINHAYELYACTGAPYRPSCELSQKTCESGEQTITTDTFDFNEATGGSTMSFNCPSSKGGKTVSHCYLSVWCGADHTGGVGLVENFNPGDSQSVFLYHGESYRFVYCEGEDTCVHTCTMGSDGCIDTNTRWYCDTNNDGCRYKHAIDCASSQVCSGGTCIASGTTTTTVPPTTTTTIPEGECAQECVSRGYDTGDCFLTDFSCPDEYEVCDSITGLYGCGVKTCFCLNLAAEDMIVCNEGSVDVGYPDGYDIGLTTWGEDKCCYGDSYTSGVIAKTYCGPSAELSPCMPNKADQNGYCPYGCSSLGTGDGKEDSDCTIYANVIKDAPIDAEEGELVGFNVELENRAHEQLTMIVEGAIYPDNWEGDVFSVGNLLMTIDEFGRCCDNNDFTQAKEVTMTAGETATTSYQVNMPMESSVDYCNNLGSAWNTKGEFHIVVATAQNCYETGETFPEYTAHTQTKRGITIEGMDALSCDSPFIACADFEETFTKELDCKLPKAADVPSEDRTECCSNFVMCEKATIGVKDCRCQDPYYLDIDKIVGSKPEEVVYRLTFDNQYADCSREAHICTGGWVNTDAGIVPESFVFITDNKYCRKASDDHYQDIRDNINLYCLGSEEMVEYPGLMDKIGTFLFGETETRPEDICRSVPDYNEFPGVSGVITRKIQGTEVIEKGDSRWFSIGITKTKDLDFDTYLCAFGKVDTLSASFLGWENDIDLSPNPLISTKSVKLTLPSVSLDCNDGVCDMDCADGWCDCFDCGSGTGDCDEATQCAEEVCEELTSKYQCKRQSNCRWEDDLDMCMWSGGVVKRDCDAIVAACEDSGDSGCWMKSLTCNLGNFWADLVGALGIVGAVAILGGAILLVFKALGK